MIKWTKKYYNNNFTDIDIDLNLYLDNIMNQNQIKEQDNISNFDIHENQYIEKLNYIEKICDDKNIIETFKKKNSLEILKLENEIVFILNKYALQNNYLNYTFFNNCICFLKKLNNILKERLKLPKIKHNQKIQFKSIPRCSYKFCNFKDSCTYNYDNSHNYCYQDHYVHNMVEADLNILINYIKLYFDDKKLIVHNKEILKSINTLSYVINHMYEELKTKTIYVREEKNIEKFHIVKKNKKKKKKKKKYNKEVNI